MPAARVGEHTLRDLLGAGRPPTRVSGGLLQEVVDVDLGGGVHDAALHGHHHQGPLVLGVDVLRVRLRVGPALHHRPLRVRSCCRP